MPAPLSRRKATTRWTRVQMALDLGALVGRKQAVDVGRQPIDRALTLTHFVAPTGLSSSCFFNASKSIRRPREMRDITVPMGTLSILAISA